MTKEQIREAWLHQLAEDFNCRAEDLNSSRIILTEPALNPGRRMYSLEKCPFQMVTTGDGAVISADKALWPFLEEWIHDKRGIWLFEHPNMLPLELELKNRGLSLAQTHHMFLPTGEIMPEGCAYPVKWLEQEDLMPFYGNPDFPNALCDEFTPHRPDMLGIAAMDGDQVIGLAGASADSRLFWQIGIDVLPSCRGKGVGTSLVRMLSNEIFRRGAIPFYGTSLSNLHSQRIALSSGFVPAWVETEAADA